MPGMRVTRSYVTTRFGQAHLRISRSATPRATPLLCLPPQPLSGRALEPLIGELGGERLTVAVDLPGFGLSDAPYAGATLDDYLGWLLEIADSTSMERFAVLGWLTGGRFAVPLAARHATRVSHLVLVGAPVPTPEQRATLKPPEIPAPRRDGGHLQSEWQKFLGWWPEDVPLDEPSDQFADTLVGMGRPERARILDVTRSVLHEEWLPRVAQPTLVLNPAGPMHEATARVAPYLRKGRVVGTAEMMFPLLSSQHAAQAADLICRFLDEE
jgi:pimeloyl-ACP methyl ester carboxylesterase